MKVLSTNDLSLAEILKQIQGVRSKAEDVASVVQPILDAVRTNGDGAICELTSKFDRWEATPSGLRVTREEIEAAYEDVDAKLLKSIRAAAKNIQNFHEGILKKKEPVIETQPGVNVWREFRPVPSAGLYVPGGKAAYPSTVLMTAIPAKAAGVPELVMCTPAGPGGKCNPVVLVAADICGVDQIYKLGGAQAIAAMAYGTDMIPKVSKIVGPGNAYVTTAKIMVFGEVDIDMPAGPSEVAVIADSRANPDWVAADLLSQLEHGEDSQAVLVTDSAAFIEAVQGAMDEQMALLPRVEIVKESREISFAILTSDMNEAVRLMNGYAPEHLEIMLANESEENALADQIMNAGSVFLGAYSSEPLGDYATGANHTLPTSGAAKMFAPLSTDSFGKMIQFQRVSKEGISGLREIVETLAEAEGLQAHGRSVSIRFDS